MMEVTFSKQWIHFRRSDRWPPTSTILKRTESRLGICDSQIKRFASVTTKDKFRLGRYRSSELIVRFSGQEKLIVNVERDRMMTCLNYELLGFCVWFCTAKIYEMQICDAYHAWSLPCPLRQATNEVR